MTTSEPQVAFKRVMLKISGEALMGTTGYGINPQKLTHYAEEIKQVVELGAQVAVVIGGGNIYRGLQAEQTGIEKVRAMLPIANEATRTPCPSLLL